MAKTRSAATPRPSAAATATTTARISFRSRTIVKKPHARPLTAATVPSSVLPAVSSPGDLAAALRHLHAAGPLLSAFIASTDASRTSLPDFHSFARTILYQQLATSAAAAIYTRFLDLLPCSGAVVASYVAVNPYAVLALAAGDLRAIGISARKAAYLHDLAAKFTAGDLPC